MNIKLKTYQERAIEELVEACKRLLKSDEQGKVCIFQAPTGSGKTLMTANFISEIITEMHETDMCFVWVSIGAGELHLQSKRSLEQIFDGAPRVSLADSDFIGGRETIARNEVVVVNWEKLRNKDRATGDWKNVLMKDGEKLNFRDVLASTRKRRKIVLIIDESHVGTGTDRTDELRHEIDADVTLEMSATPNIKPTLRDQKRGIADYVEVTPSEVIDEGMIKKELVINHDLGEISDDEMDSQNVVLESAYQKRLELKQLFREQNSNITPLVLVQIPTAEAGEVKMAAVEKFLADKGITEANRKLAIWTAEQKSKMLDWVAESDSEIEFLIFKQAIAMGWDCPRAHILIKFRESKSETFEIQTVGRILRMPEHKHYANEELNRGYIYTNVQNIIVKKEDYNPNIIKTLNATLKEVYRPPKLTSYYKQRVDYGGITPSFEPVFIETACRAFGLEQDDKAMFEQNIRKVKNQGISLDTEDVRHDIAANVKVQGEKFDETQGRIEADEFAHLKLSEDDKFQQFKQIIKSKLGPYRNVKRSVSKAVTVIYIWFQSYLRLSPYSFIQTVFIRDGNRERFEEILEEAIDKYQTVRIEEMRKRAEESEQFYEFEIEKEASYNEPTSELEDYKKYVYDKCYLDKERPDTERSFEQFLEDSEDRIVWWWKNGENKRTYFGIKYEYQNGDIHTFYPDYLVQFSDGRVGIFEVKHEGDRDGETSTKAKAESLQRYIKGQNDTKLFGGIAIERGRTWWINQKPAYHWSKCKLNDWSDWDRLEF